MAVVSQVLPIVGMLGVAFWLLTRLERPNDRDAVKRPREDPSLQQHQQTVRSQVGGDGGFGI